MFNALDYLLILFLVIGAAWGLLRGSWRLLISLFSLYVGLVLTLRLYQPLANFFRNLVPAMSVSGSEALAFVLLLFVLVNGFNLLTRYFATPPEDRKRKKRGDLQEAVTSGSQRFIIGPLTRLLGLLIGIVVAIVWISLVLAVFQFVVRSGWPTANDIRVSILHQLNSSFLVPVFNEVLNRIYWSVRIWVPGEVPSLFAGLFPAS